MKAIRFPVLSAVLLVAAGLAPAAKHRPNVVFICTDQQHAAMLSCAGNPYVKTPAIDSLARNGARFERAYCTNPVCLPSRFSMLSGVLPSRVGLEMNAPANVPEAILTHAMGRVFRDAGYETAYGGKVHTPMPLAAIGFEKLSDDERQGLAEACTQFLNKKHDRPFLLVASFVNPHDICFMVIKDYFRATGHRDRALDMADALQPALSEALKSPSGMSRDEFFAKVCPPLPANFEIPPGEPENLLPAKMPSFRTYARQNWTPVQWRLHRWAYARLTERVDSEIAQVLAALRNAGLEENTLVVFTSDHGEMDAAHRLESKAVLYEEAVRVPLLVSWKGVTCPGLVDRQHLVSTGLDLIPTLCDFAGIRVPAELKGRSVRKLAEGRPATPWRDYLVVENLGSRLLRTDHYKYIVYGAGARREQLIDLDHDPGEMNSLAADPAYTGALKEHRRLLQTWYQENGEKLDRKYVVP